MTKGVKIVLNNKGNGKWIPVTERLPENDDKVLCCTRTKSGLNNLILGYYDRKQGRWCCGMNSNVVAWQPLPEPYQGQVLAKGKK